MDHINHPQMGRVITVFTKLELYVTWLKMIIAKNRNHNQKEVPFPYCFSQVNTHHLLVEPSISSPCIPFLVSEYPILYSVVSHFGSLPAFSWSPLGLQTISDTTVPCGRRTGCISVLSEEMSVWQASPFPRPPGDCFKQLTHLPTPGPLAGSMLVYWRVTSGRVMVDPIMIEVTVHDDIWLYEWSWLIKRIIHLEFTLLLTFLIIIDHMCINSSNLGGRPMMSLSNHGVYVTSWLDCVVTTFNSIYNLQILQLQW